MSRPLRIDLENGWYHITARGHNRQAIYLKEADRHHFLELLGEMAERYGVELHGYVLMENHYHLMIRTPRANASQALQWLNVSYSVWWNRRYNRCGSLFQGRYKSVLVEGGEWLLTLSQYLHFNPVAVKGLGLGKREQKAENRGWQMPTREIAQQRLETIRKYRWSSYRAYAGYEKGPAWLITRDVLALSRGGREGYRKATESRLLSGQEECFWDRLRWGAVLGGTRFAEATREKISTGREIAGRVSLRKRATWEQIVSVVERQKAESWERFRDRRGDWGRDVALWAARQWGGYTLSELAHKVGGVDYTAVAKGIRRLRVRAQHDKKLNKIMKTIAANLGITSYVKT